MSAIVELGLRNGHAGHAIGPHLKELIDGFLQIVLEHAPGADADDLESFLAGIRDIRGQIASADHYQAVRRLAAVALGACEQFLKRSRRHFSTRERELTETIAILRDTAFRVLGDTDFHDELRASSRRVRSLAQLEDIRKLKSHLVEEAAALEQAVEAKQRRDREAMTALAAQVESLQSRLSLAEEQAAIDPLTKVSNRTGFDRALARLVRAAHAAGEPLAVALLDIDFFKQINDTHGHPVGDRVLLCAAQWIGGAVRHTDIVARLGGDEFAAILPGSELATAEARLSTVISRIASQSFEYDDDGGRRMVQFTMSCGLTQLGPGEKEVDLLRRADQALYDAKSRGRNRVVARKRSLLASLLG